MRVPASAGALLALLLAPSSCLNPPRPEAAVVGGAPGVTGQPPPNDDLPLTTDGGLPERTFPWPAATRGAISLTYDDGLLSHIETVGPSLEKHRLHGTFFITGNSSPVRDALGKWTALYKQGNEIAAHTMNHPCDGAQDWVKKGFALQDYDLPRMEQELKENIAQLVAIGKKTGPYTFAYPCGMTWLGEHQASYKDLVTKYFFAARGTTATFARPEADSFAELPAVGADKNPDDLVDFARQVERDGGWLIIMFHGVGGDHMSVTAAQHERLLKYLDKHRTTLWTDTFLNVSQFVAQHRAPPKVE